jgi:cysteinyl-tRNA synthetase
LLSVSYRKQLNFAFDALATAQTSLQRIKEFMFRLNTAKVAAGANPQIGAAVSEADRELEDALDDDLNPARALASVFDLVRKCNTALSENAIREDDRREVLQFFEKVDQRLAIVPPMEQLVQADQEVEALIAQRNEARRNRDFAMADKIRQQLLDLGVLIEDTREGTKWRRK